jgi:ATP-binding cassette subfamily B protein
VRARRRVRGTGRADNQYPGFYGAPGYAGVPGYPEGVAPVAYQQGWVSAAVRDPLLDPLSGYLPDGRPLFRDEVPWNGG